MLVGGATGSLRRFNFSSLAGAEADAAVAAIAAAAWIGKWTGGTAEEYTASLTRWHRHDDQTTTTTTTTFKDDHHYWQQQQQQQQRRPSSSSIVHHPGIVIVIVQSHFHTTAPHPFPVRT